MDKDYEVIQGDCLEVLRTLPKRSVHCVVTSPPYWGLRQYLFEGAVVLRRNLTRKQRDKIITELEEMGITPKC